MVFSHLNYTHFIQVIALERHVEEGHVLTEYKNITEKHQMHEKIMVQEHERQRDRVKSVVPFEHNCVRIQSTAANPTGYINASCVEVYYTNIVIILANLFCIIQ